MARVVDVIAAEAAGTFVVVVDGREQSHVDLQEPTRLSFDYVRRMADVVDAAAAPGLALRVLHVGGGGLTLARYVAATRPTSAQIVLEPDAALTGLVRERLPLPRRSGIKVRDVDGRTGVLAVRDASVDVVLLDAFEAGVVPLDLVTREAFVGLARVLAPTGLLAVNLVDRAPFAHTRRVLAGVRESFAHHVVGAEPSTWNGRRHGNLVLVAGHAAVPSDTPRASTAGTLGGYRVLSARRASDVLGGGAPFVDADLLGHGA